VCDRFEEAWLAGQSPRIEDHLGDTSGTERAALLRELIALEVFYRQQRGECPRPEEFRQRFPDLEEGWLMGTCATLAGPPPGSKPTQDAPAVPQQVACPHCQNPTAVNPGHSGDVLCPACGGTFPIGALSPSETTYTPLGPGSRMDDYEVLAELGHGAMGSVFRARQLSANRTVALKVIRPDKLLDLEVEDRKKWLKRFRWEAEAVAALDHPHIVPLYQIGEWAPAGESPRPFFSMKLIEGCGLSSQLERFRNDPRAAARLVATVARAVHHAHQRQILHRDLKPSNIILDRDGQPHVTDFGLALRTDGAQGSLSSPGAIVGTPEYMAPEQVRAERNLTTAVDVYGVGAVLYALLTGHPPHQGPESFVTLMMVLESNPRPPRERNPKVERDLETICLKCLEKNSRRRYGSADALAEDLERYLAREPIQARPTGPAERLLLWCRRKPLLAGLAAAVAVLVLVVTVGTFLAAVLVKGARDDAVQRAHEAIENAQRTREASERARQAEAQAEKEAAAARASNDESQALLGRTLVAKAMRLWEEGDSAGALVWLAEALRRDRADPQRTEIHRVRLAAFLQTIPRPIKSWEGLQLLDKMEFSPCGSRLLCVKDKTLELCDAETGQRVGETLVLASRPTRTLFSPDGHWLIVQERSGDALPGVHLLDVAKGMPVDCQARRAILARAIGFGPESDRVVTAEENGPPYRVRVWEFVTGKPISEVLDHPFEVGTAILNSDGSRLVTIFREFNLTAELLWLRGAKEAGPARKALYEKFERAAEEVRLWDLHRGQLLGEPLRHANFSTTARFTPDETMVLLDRYPRGNDSAKPKNDPAKLNREVCVLNCATGKTIQTYHASADTTSGPEMTSDGACIFSVTKMPGQLLMCTVWDSRSQKTINCRILPSENKLLISGTLTILSPDGKTFSMLAGLGRFTNRKTTLIPNDSLGKYNLNPNFSPDGRLLMDRWSHSLKLADALTGKLIHPPLEPQSGLLQWDFSPTGRHVLATNRLRGTAHLWGIADGPGHLQNSVEEQSSIILASNADGSRVAEFRSGDLQLYDGHTHQPVGPSHKVERRRRFGTSTFSSDGTHFCYATPDDKTPGSFSIFVLEAATGLEARPSYRLQMEEGGGRDVRYGFTNHGLWLEIDRPGAPHRALQLMRGLTALMPVGKLLLPPFNVFRVRTLNLVTDERMAHYFGTTLEDPRVGVHGRAMTFSTYSSGLESQLGLMDVETGRVLYPRLRAVADKGDLAAVFNSDGSRFLVRTPDGVQVCDTTTAEPLYPALTGPKSDPTSPDSTLVGQPFFSPDGRRIVTLGMAEKPGKQAVQGSVRVWDVATGRPVPPDIKRDVPVEKAIVSRDGRFLRVLWGDGAWQSWEIATAQPMTPLVRTAFPGAEDWNPAPPPDDTLLAWADWATRRRVNEFGSPVALDEATLRRCYEQVRTAPPRASSLRPAELARWHHDQAEQCKKAEQWYAAAWHLGREIALNSHRETGALYLQRAEAWSKLAFWDKAAADCTKALAHENRVDTAKTLLVRARAFEGLKRPGKALVDYDRAVAAEPSDGRARLERGGFHARAGRFELAAVDFAALLHPRSDRPRKAVGDPYASLRPEGKARSEIVARLLDAITALSGLPIDAGYLRYYRALAHRGSRDLQAYRETCSQIAPTMLDHLFPCAWACVLAPDSMPSFSGPLKWIENPFLHPNHDEVLNNRPVVGAVLYRAGRFKDALQSLEDSLASNEGSPAWHFLLLAMTCHRIDRSAEATKWLAKAVIAIEDGEDAEEWEWHDRLELQLLRQEAEDLLKAKKP
jgi:tetratricopeptide (TPR) repeat protein/tRNA A-37 threonylcarbamoyl transferase component Bud32